MVTKQIKKVTQKVFERVVNIAPFIMLFASAITGFLSSIDFYSKVYVYLPDSIGYSLLTDLLMIKIYWRRSYCSPTKMAVVGLITMNILSIAFKNTAAYNPIYDMYVAIACLSVIVSLKFFK